MKKYLLPALIALFCLGSVSCKKNNKAEPIPETPVVIPDVYKNWRVNYLSKNGQTYIQFIYDNTNKLITSRNYGVGQNGNQIIGSFTNYLYNANGKLLKTITNFNYLNGIPNDKQNIIYVEDYTYSNNNILQSYTSSTVDATDPANPVTLSVNYSSVYTYNQQSGKLETITIKDANNMVTLTSTYVYSTAANGDPQVNLHAVPASGSAYDAIYTYYANIIDPDPRLLPGVPVNSPFMQRSFQSTSGNQNYNSQTSYTLDADGKIKTYTTTGDIAPLNGVFTYVYEAKQ